MKQFSVKFWLTFAAALVLGVVLHFVYTWLPNPVTALISPVRESIWEHLKILFYPLLFAVPVLGGKQYRTPRLLSLLLVCALELGFSWLYYIALRGESPVFGPALYGVLMLMGFLLPRVLWPLSEWPGVGRACALLTVLLGLLLVWFTFFPPEGLLFADLSYAMRTFLTIPV